MSKHKTAATPINMRNSEDSGRSDERARLLRARGLPQHIIDFLVAPLRMIVLPDAWSRCLGLTSLEEERLRAVLPEIRGRLLDIGAGTNRLAQLYGDGIGVDVLDWGGGALVVDDTRRLPFDDGSFDTASFVACLNHIPYREEALLEAHRLLRTGGRVIVTMIGSIIGEVGHKLWWYSEDKHREVADGELMGMVRKHVEKCLRDAGFRDIVHRRFVYGLNHLFVAIKA